jgi:hypothetical protein
METELKFQRILQEREGGETEVATPVGFVNLVTDAHVIEIKHVTDWQDGAKVLLYASYFPSRKPRVHLVGAYVQDVRTLVERSLNQLGILTTWEREPMSNQIGSG